MNEKPITCRTSEAGDIFNGAGGRAGLKLSGFQGGVQVPMIVRWPGKTKPGNTTNRLAAQHDVLPTVADITGLSVFVEKETSAGSIPRNHWIEPIRF